MRAAFAFLLTLSLAAPAHADLSFVQIVQAQSDRGQDGLFGKSWIQIRGKKMRVVSGYARKVRSGTETIGPRRLVQLIDLSPARRTLLNPESRTYEYAPIEELDYGNKLVGALKKGRPKWRIIRTDVSLTRRKGSKRLLGSDCAHYHLHATLTLRDASGHIETARMDQHVWAAPITGTLSKTLMSLIAYENAYRKASKTPLSPLDYERYQVKEAAAYLRVEESDLRSAIERFRERFRDMPSYPVASSVSWWPSVSATPIIDLPLPETEETPTPATLGNLKPRQDSTKFARSKKRRRTPRPRFERIDWGKTERKINKSFFRVPRRPPEALISVRSTRPREVYPDFAAELQSILKELIDAQDKSVATAAIAERKRRSAAAKAPFYEIYTELHGLETETVLSDRDFRIPKDYRQKPSRANK